MSATRILSMVFFLLVVLAITINSVSQAAEKNINIAAGRISLEESKEIGQIHWYQGNRGTIEAIGSGGPPISATSALQGRRLAYQEAIADAYRNLTEVINNVQIASDTAMKNLTLSSDEIKTRISDVIKGAKIIKTIPQPYGSYVVIMSVNMFGANSVAEIAFNSAELFQAQDFPKPSANYQQNTTAMLSDVNTGVIVDARGLGFSPSFSPRIYDESGRIVYGIQHFDADFCVSQGIVEYIRGVDLHKTVVSGESRAGIRPLVIKAQKIVANNCNVVISSADADAILEQNEKWGILKKGAVVFAL